MKIVNSMPLNKFNECYQIDGAIAHSNRSYSYTINVEIIQTLKLFTLAGYPYTYPPSYLGLEIVWCNTV